MDSILQKITDFAFQLGNAGLTPEAVHECKRRFIDSLACAIGGYDAQPCVIARAVAGKGKTEKTARVFGTLDRATAENHCDLPDYMAIRNAARAVTP